MGHKRLPSLPKGEPAFHTLRDDEYDDDGRPKGRLVVEYREFRNASGNVAEWIAEYEDLPGYLGFGDTIATALSRLWQDFGERPHFRVQRIKRTSKQWERHIISQGKAEAAGTMIGLVSRTSELRNMAARRFQTKTDKAREANDRLRAKFLSELGRFVAGYPSLSEGELEHLAKQKNFDDLALAAHMPWQLERREARAKFPSMDS